RVRQGRAQLLSVRPRCQLAQRRQREGDEQQETGPLDGRLTTLAAPLPAHAGERTRGRRTGGAARVTGALQADDGALRRAAAGSLDDIERRDAGGERYRRCSGGVRRRAVRRPDRLLHSLVELHVAAAFGLHRAAVVVAAERSPRLLGLFAEAAVAWAGTGAERVLLYVEAPFHVRRPRPQRPEAGADLRGDHRPPQVRARAGLVVEGE